MLFNSLQFLVFFPVVTILYWILPPKYRWLHLLVASCIFYSAFVPIYLLILLVTIVIDYFAGIYIEKAQEGHKKKQYLTFSILANIGILAFFKYYNFFLDNIVILLNQLGVAPNNVPYLNILLPIGLSFHTFQALSYTIEVYRGKQKAEKHFGIYALYVMFYPQLVAGPIERPQNVLYQFHKRNTFNLSMLMDGLRLMLWGFFKKVVVADRLALYVSSVYIVPENYHYLNLIIATLFFAVQIYCDFSGYSDIALGSAQTMGYKLMLNFNRPYFALNIQEFWKRWHISLSTWFRDYLYISLGGNRVSMFRTYLNVAIVFILSGLWHGANWTLIVWGFLHACYITVFMLYSGFKGKSGKKNIIFDCLSWLLTFILVVFAWIYFRAENMTIANQIVGKIVNFDNQIPFSFVIVDKIKGKELGYFYFLFSCIFTALFFIIEYLLTPLLEELNKSEIYDVLFFSFCITTILIFGVFYNNSFIYFQF